MTNLEKIGQHNGIEYYYRESDGVDFYLSTKTNKTAMSLRGIARMLECNPKTVHSKTVTLKIAKDAELPTRKGMGRVTFIVEDDIPILLRSIESSNRIKKETRQNAKEQLNKLAQAGFRLMALLQVAPEQIAQLGINHLKSEDQVKTVETSLADQKNYLDSFHGLNRGLEKHGAKPPHYATVHKYNNNLVGVKDGDRPNMKRKEKLTMIAVQVFEELALDAKPTQDAWHAVNRCKKVGKQTINNIALLG